MRIPGITRIPYFAGNMNGKQGTTVHTFVLFLIWDPHECPLVGAAALLTELKKLANMNAKNILMLC